MDEQSADRHELEAEHENEKGGNTEDVAQANLASREPHLREGSGSRRLYVIAGGVVAAVILVYFAFSTFFGGAAIPRISGNWVVDWEKMIAANDMMGVDRSASAWEIAGYMDMRIRFSGNTIRMRDSGRGFHDCTATYRVVEFDSEDELLDTVEQYDDRMRACGPSGREDARESIRSGELNLVVAEITAVDNNGEGLDIFEVGQTCVFFAPGPKSTAPDEMTFCFHWFGGDVAALWLVKASTTRGKELLREMEAREREAMEDD